MLAQLVSLSLLARVISAYISKLGHLKRERRTLLVRLFYCPLFAMLLFCIQIALCMGFAQFNRVPADINILEA